MHVALGLPQPFASNSQKVACLAVCPRYHPAQLCPQGKLFLVEPWSIAYRADNQKLFLKKQLAGWLHQLSAASG